MADLDKLNIVIEVDDKKANEKLDALLKKLESVSLPTQNSKAFTDLSNRLKESEKVVESLQKELDALKGNLTNVSTKGLDNVNETIKDIGETAKKTSEATETIAEGYSTPKKNLDDVAEGVRNIGNEAEKTKTAFDGLDGRALAEMTSQLNAVKMKQNEVARQLTEEIGKSKDEQNEGRIGSLILQFQSLQKTIEGLSAPAKEVEERFSKMDAIKLANSKSELDLAREKLDLISQKLAQYMNEGNKAGENTATTEFKRQQAIIEKLEQEIEGLYKKYSRADAIDLTKSNNELDLAREKLSLLIDKLAQYMNEGNKTGINQTRSAILKQQESIEKIIEKQKKVAEEEAKKRLEADETYQAYKRQNEELEKQQNVQRGMDFAKQTGQASTLQMKLDSIYEKIGRLQNDPNANKGQLASLVEQANKLQAKIDELGRKEVNTQGFSQLAEVLGRVGRVASGVAHTIGNIGAKATKMLWDFATAPYSLPIKGLTAIGKKIDAIRGKIFKMVKMRIYRLIAKQIVGGFSEGLQNAYHWASGFGDEFARSMDTIATSMLYLKNSIGAMTAPLINALAPAIDFVVDKFVNMLNIINQVIAKLTGRDTWIKAVKVPKAFKDSTDDATGSVKKLEKELITILGIDEINPLEGMDDSPTGSGSGSASGTDYGSMFTQETVAISDKISSMFDVFKQAWDSKGKGVVDAWEYSMTRIKTVVDSIKTSWSTVWNNGTGQKIIENVLTIVTNILTTIGNIANKFNEGWNTDNLGTEILQNLLNIVEGISGFWADFTGAVAKFTENVDFEPLLRAFNNLLIAIQPIVTAVGNLVMWLAEDIAFPFADWVIEEGLPTAINFIAEVLQKISEINLEPLKNSLKNVLEKLNPIVENIAKLIEWGTKEIILPVAKWTIEEALPQALDTIASALTVIDDVTKAGAPYAKAFFDNIFKPLSQASGKAFLEDLETIQLCLDNIHAFFSGEKSFSATVIENIALMLLPLLARLNAIKEIIDALTSGDLSRAEQGFKDFINPKGSEFYLEMKAKITGTDQTGLTPEQKKLLNMEARLDKTDGTALKEQYKKLNGITANFEKTTDGLTIKEKTFDTIGNFFKRTIGWGTLGGIFDVTGNFTQRSEGSGFSKTFDSIANFFKRSEGSGFSKTFDSVANFFKRTEGSGFSKIFDSVANFSSRSEGKKFSKTFDAVANFVTRSTNWNGKKGGSWLTSGGSLFWNAVANFTTRSTNWYSGNGFTMTSGKYKLPFWNSIANFITRRTNWYSGNKFVKDGKPFWDSIANFISRTTGGKFSSTFDAIAYFVSRTFGKNFSTTVEMTGNIVKRILGISTEIDMTANIKKGSMDKITIGGVTYEKKAEGGAFFGGKWHNIPQYAVGGSPSHGSLFYAGENGAELVGHVGGRTEVLNQSQLASTMYSSVMSANASQNRLLQEQNNLLREMLSKQGDSRAYVVASDLIDGMSQLNRRDGRTLVAMGV